MQARPLEKQPDFHAVTSTSREIYEDERLAILPAGAGGFEGGNWFGLCGVKPTGPISLPRPISNCRHPLILHPRSDQSAGRSPRHSPGLHHRPIFSRPKNLRFRKIFFVRNPRKMTPGNTRRIGSRAAQVSSSSQNIRPVLVRAIFGIHLTPERHAKFL